MHLQKIVSILISVQLALVTLATPAVSYGNDLYEGDHNAMISEHTGKDCTAKTKLIERRIESGLNYLYEKQLPSGEFPVYVSFSADMSNKSNAKEFYDNVAITFDAGLILHTLNLVDNRHNKEIVQTMKTKATTFLLDNMEPQGVWRYFGKDHIVPPDVDDTSIIFAALFESGVNISDKSLDYMLDYKTPDGVFYTWINSEEWLDPSNPFYQDIELRENIIDLNVNANALYAYSLKKRNQSDVIKYLNGIAENKSFINASRYYPSPLVFTYFITKVYSDGNVKELEPSLINIRDYILETQNPDGGWGNDLDTALATNSLINMGYKGMPLEKAIDYILNNQGRNGSWNIYTMHYIARDDPLSPDIFFGSQELTTSFSLEALIKYKKLISEKADGSVIDSAIPALYTAS